VLAALHEEGREADVEIHLHEDWCFLAVQGPRSVDVVSDLIPSAAELAYMRCTEATFRQTPLVLTRSGYTGEVGFELFPLESAVHDLWSALLKAGEPFGIQPVGLGARDTLRLEM